MWVATCALFLLASLLAELPRPVSSPNVEPPLLNTQTHNGGPADETSESYGFLTTTTISILSHIPGLRKQDDDDGEQNRNDADIGNEIKRVEEKLEGLKEMTPGMTKDNPETLKEDIRVHDKVDYVEVVDNNSDNDDDVLNIDNEKGNTYHYAQDDQPTGEDQKKTKKMKMKKDNKDKDENLVEKERRAPEKAADDEYDDDEDVVDNATSVEKKLTLDRDNATSLLLHVPEHHRYRRSLDNLNDLDRFIQACDNCMQVSRDTPHCPLNTLAIELKKWFTELQELLSSGCQLKGYDDSSKCCHSHPALELAVGEMTKLVRQTLTSFQSSCSKCPRDGSWADWGEWGDCYADPRIRRRYRKCTNPAPMGGGRPCLGRDTEIMPCSEGSSGCVDGNWGPWMPWSHCTQTCGMGQRTRRRRCDSPSPNFCGRRCEGRDFEINVLQCGGPIGTWSPWSPWSRCSESCGLGLRSRRRRCATEGLCGCPGPDLDTDRCDSGPCCVPRQWTPWVRWSPCDVTCNRGRRGTRMRTRVCQSVEWATACETPCRGLDKEVDSCVNLPSCEGPVQWTEWNHWCPCNCRLGLRARRRKCKTTNGKDVDVGRCPGLARMEEVCDVQEQCPVCIDSCVGRKDNEYPACTSCKDYITCRGGRILGLYTCPPDTEYDAFIRGCNKGPAPSCSLADCVRDCVGLRDRRYPVCNYCSEYIECSRGRYTIWMCPFGQEYNHHAQRCFYERSPSCVRPRL